ncbi:excalibur calcium-binding domain-containing protein [Actinomyces johnsonii]|uniref:excalibur calcium-binding domain-containing protein n=1 Tax=Actinomyces johnsonii TaxID=544581 RepID=UPI003F8EB30C
MPTVIYSPSPVPATEAPAAPPVAAPSALGAEQGSDTSERDTGSGASSGTGEAPAQPESDSGGVYYRNCKAARDAGAAPLYRGQPGYRPELDRDKDGIACEWK